MTVRPEIHECSTTRLKSMSYSVHIAIVSKTKQTISNISPRYISNIIIISLTDKIQLQDKMKSMIVVIFAGLMLIGIVAASDFEKAKQDILNLEESFLKDLQESLPKMADAEKEALLLRLKQSDKRTGERVKYRIKKWQEEGFNPEQVEELTSVLSGSRNRMTAVIEKLENRLSAAQV